MKHISLFLLFCLVSNTLSSQGLQFKSTFTSSIDERTSYDVFHHTSPCLSKQLFIEFELAFYDLKSFGNIIRIRNSHHQNVYNLIFDKRENFVFFNFVEEGKDNLSEFKFGINKFSKAKWHKVTISFDLITNTIRLTLDDQEAYIENKSLSEKICPQIYFGKSEHMIDVPAFSIKELKIQLDDDLHQFSLNESEGEDVHDSRANIVGHVSNPTWLIRDSYHWKEQTSYSSRGMDVACFDEINERFIFAKKDSVVFYDLHSKEYTSRPYKNTNPVKMNLGAGFLDMNKNRLYTYEASDIPKEKASFAALSLDNNTWITLSRTQLPMQLHHHCSYFDSKRNRLLLFGGFGDQKYNGDFYSYDFETNSWNTPSFGGDKIPPRYFSGLGHDSHANYLYILGGMGNESGKQILGRNYYYDLYRVDLENQKVKKLWEIPWHDNNIVSVRNMIVLGDSAIYTLMYPEHMTNSHLKLYQFSIKDGSYKILGDSIPIISDKIETNANLYFSKSQNSLCCIVQEYDNAIFTKKIYTLVFPPVSHSDINYYMTDADNKLSYKYWLLIGGLIVVVVFLFIELNRRKKKKESSIPVDKDNCLPEAPISLPEIDISLVTSVIKANSIYLFGQFSVFDKAGKDITYMFSARLKYTFILILKYSIHNGISSQEMSQILWSDRNPQKTKNIRGVTINDIRKILNELDGVELVYEKGYFKLVVDKECYCDLFRFYALLENKHLTDLEQNEILSILYRGEFLKLIDEEIFDSLKESINQKGESLLMWIINNYYLHKDYTKVLQSARILFVIDPLNEKALFYELRSLIDQNKIEQANKRFSAFSSEYKQMIGEDYPHPFSSFQKSSQPSFLRE